VAHSKFDDLIKALNFFEQGMAENTLTRKSEIAKRLDDISNQATILLNQGGLPTGSKSTLLKIRKLVKETAEGLRTDVFSSLGPIRRISRDHLGTLHAALNAQLGGGLTADEKTQIRENYSSDEDTTFEINRLLEAFDPGSLTVGGNKRPLNDALDDVASFLDQNFTLSQLRSIQPYTGEVTPGGKPVKNPDSVWNDLTYSEVLAATENTPKGKTKLAALKRELVKKHDDDLASLSESYKELSRRLPRTLKHAFAPIYYPVVPVFQDIGVYKNPTRLENAGLKVTRVGDHFIVLENQLLLCIDLDRVGVKGSIRLTRDGQKMKTVNNNNELEAKIHEIVGHINETARHSGTAFAVASDTVVRNPNNQHIALVWLVEEKVRKKLANTLTNTKVQWDIPRHNIEAPKLSHGKTPAATQKLIDASILKHRGGK
jgi:hypothetical protein